MSGPPWNRSFEEIGWLTTRQIALMLRHRNAEGELDYESMRADAKAHEQRDPEESFKNMRRMQGWSEELIQREAEKMRQADG